MESTDQEYWQWLDQQQDPIFASGPGTEVRTFIQWKGTDVCMDFHCKCGEHLHIDGDFVYAVHCPVCDRVYRLGNRVAVFEVPEDQRETTLEGCCAHPDPEPDYLKG